MNDLPRHSLDVELHDTDLIDEIRLLADVMVVAGDSLGRLDDATLDEVLGLSPGQVLPLPDRLPAV